MTGKTQTAGRELDKSTTATVRKPRAASPARTTAVRGFDTNTVAARMADLVTAGLAQKQFALNAQDDSVRGSIGWFVSDKLHLDGADFQCTVTVTLVNSRKDKRLKITASRDDVVTTLCQYILATARFITTSTGKPAVNVSTKMLAGGDMYQVSANAVKYIPGASKK